MKKALAIMILAFCLLFTAAQAATLHVTWDANSEPDLDGYKVYYAIPGDPAWLKNGNTYTFSSDTFPCMLDVGKVTSCEIGDVPAGPFVAAVTAYDESLNESDYSEPAAGFNTGNKRVITVTVKAPPEPPKNVVARIIEVILGWLNKFIMTA